LYILTKTGRPSSWVYLYDMCITQILVTAIKCHYFIQLSRVSMIFIIPGSFVFWGVARLYNFQTCLGILKNKWCRFIIVSCLKKLLLSHTRLISLEIADSDWKAIQCHECKYTPETPIREYSLTTEILQVPQVTKWSSL